MLPEAKTVPMFEGLTMTSAGTVFGQVDTIGFDHLRIDLSAGTGEAASTAVTTLRLCESDTNSAMTAYTDGTPITACVGAAAVSTSAGFVLPALSSTKQNTYQINLNLLGRKRYIGANFAATKQTVGVGCLASLSRRNAGADPANVTQATTVDGTRVVINA
jgi:hypothetical protein